MKTTISERLLKRTGLLAAVFAAALLGAGCANMGESMRGEPMQTADAWEAQDAAIGKRLYIR